MESSTNPKKTTIPVPKTIDFKETSKGSQRTIGIRAPRAIASPPLLGMGRECTFLSSGVSSIRRCTARLLKTGMRAMVVKTEMSRVDRKIIVESLGLLAWYELIQDWHDHCVKIPGPFFQIAGGFSWRKQGLSGA
jgi:hypothetical protein